MKPVTIDTEDMVLCVSEYKEKLLALAAERGALYWSYQGATKKVPRGVWLEALRHDHSSLASRIVWFDLD